MSEMSKEIRRFPTYLPSGLHTEEVADEIEHLTALQQADAELAAARYGEIERLTEYCENECVDTAQHNAIVKQKNAEVKRLRAALEPFAKAHEAMIEPNRIIDPYEHITLHDLRVASEALKDD